MSLKQNRSEGEVRSLIKERVVETVSTAGRSEMRDLFSLAGIVLTPEC